MNLGATCNNGYHEGDYCIAECECPCHGPQAEHFRSRALTAEAQVAELKGQVEYAHTGCESHKAELFAQVAELTEDLAEYHRRMLDQIHLVAEYREALEAADRLLDEVSHKDERGRCWRCGCSPPTVPEHYYFCTWDADWQLVRAALSPKEEK